MAFESRRMAKSYRQAIEGSPDTVFPLLCPVREAEWLDGWAYRMIFSASGLAEAGAVFATSSPDEPDTIWIVSRHDPAARAIEFARVTPGARTCMLRIAVSPRDAGGSWVDVAYEYTTLAPPGDAFLERWTDEAFAEGVRFWEDSMNHFLRTGTKLPRHPARL